MEFELNKIKENIYRVKEPYFYEHSNIFILKGSKFDLVVDSGVGVENLNLFLNENKFLKTKVFLTHSHFDHAGGINFFDSKDLFINSKIINNLKNRKLMALEYLKPKDFNKNIFKKLNLVAQKFCSDFEVRNLGYIKPFMKDIINNGFFSFKIINTPGHTNDSYILFDKKNKLLITGDTLYDGTPYAGMPNSNKKSFIKSLEKIKKLDFDLVLPGHNKVMDKNEAIIVIDKWISLLK